MKMDRETAKNKRSISYDIEEIEDDSLQTQSKRNRPSFLNGFEAEPVLVAEVLSAQQVAILESFIRSVVLEVVEIEVNSYARSILARNGQLSHEVLKETVFTSRTLKLKLFFFNQTAPTIFTNNEIEAENGKPLLVAICDTTNSNAIIKTGPLSSALVEFVVLNGDFGFGQRQEETSWSVSDFNQSIVSKREGKKPLITGNNMIVYLKNGVGFIKGLSFSDNSSWTKSKKFRLGAKIVDKKILTKFPRIGEAVSEPFRVMDHRGEVYKKHHPPRREDEIWRLEGIGKDGVYHNRLSLKDIKTVGDFLKTYHVNGATYLRKLLGEKVPKITWKKMISNALECEAPIVPSASDPSFGVHLVGTEAMEDQAFDQNLGDSDGLSENIGDHKFDGELQGLVSSQLSNLQSLFTQQNLMGRRLEVGEQNSFNCGQLFSDPEFGGQLQDLPHLAGNYEAVGGQVFEGIGGQDYNFIFNDDYPPLLPHGQASTSYNHNKNVEKASTRNQHYQERPWTGLVPKPK